MQLTFWRLQDFSGLCVIYAFFKWAPCAFLDINVYTDLWLWSASSHRSSAGWNYAFSLNALSAPLYRDITAGCHIQGRRCLWQNVFFSPYLLYRSPGRMGKQVREDWIMVEIMACWLEWDERPSRTFFRGGVFFSMWIIYFSDGALASVKVPLNVPQTS